MLTFLGHLGRFWLFCRGLCTFWAYYFSGVEMQCFVTKLTNIGYVFEETKNQGGRGSGGLDIVILVRKPH